MAGLPPMPVEVDSTSFVVLSSLHATALPDVDEFPHGFGLLELDALAGGDFDEFTIPGIAAEASCATTRRYPGPITWLPAPALPQCSRGSVSMGREPLSSRRR